MQGQTEEGYFSPSQTSSLSVYPINRLFEDSSLQVMLANQDKSFSYSLLDADLDYSGLESLSGKGILLERIQDAHKSIDELNNQVHKYEQEIGQLRQSNKVLLLELSGLKKEHEMTLKHHEVKDVLLEKVNSMSNEYYSLLESHQTFVIKHNQQEKYFEEVETKLKETLKQNVDLTNKNNMLVVNGSEIEVKLKNCLEDLHSKEFKIKDFIEQESLLLNKITIKEIENKNISNEYEHIMKLLYNKEQENLAYENQIDYLKHIIEERNNNLCDQKMTVENIRKKFNTSLNESDKKMNKIQNENIKLQNENNNLQNEKANLEEILNSLRREKDKLQNENINFINSSELLTNKFEKTNVELSIKDETIDLIRNEKLKLEEKLKSLDLQFHKTKSESFASIQEKNEIKKSLMKYKKDRISIINKYKTLLSESENMRIKLNSVEANFADVSLNNKNLLEKIDLLKNENKTEVENLIQKYMKDIDTYKVSNNSLKMEMQELEKTNLTFDEENEIVIGEKILLIENQQNEIDKLINTNNDLDDKMINLQRNYDNVMDKLHYQDQLVVNSKLQIQKLSKKLSLKSNEFDEFEKEKLAEINNLTKTLSSYEEKLEELNLYQINHTRQTELIDNDNYKQLVEQKESYQKLESERDQLLTGLKLKDRELESCSSKSELDVTTLQKKYTNEIENLKKRNIELRTENLTEKEKLQAIENYADQLNTRFKELELTNKVAQTKQNKLEEEFKCLEKENSQKILELAELKKELTSKTTDNKKLKFHLCKLKEEFCEKEKTFEEQLLNNSNDLVKRGDYSLKLDKLKSEYRKKVLQLQELTKKNEELTSKLKKSSEEIHIMKELNKKLEDMSKKNETENEKLKISSVQNEFDLKTLKGSYEDLLSKELSKQKSQFLYKENQLLKKLAQST